MPTVSCSCRCGRGKAPIILTPNEEYKGNTVKIAAETQDLQALIAYVQKLGMNRGKWRDLFEPQSIEVIAMSPSRARRNGSPTARRSMSGAASAAMGRRATATDLRRPSSTIHARGTSTPAVFKFRLTSEPVPTDGDLLRTITRGVRGTAMPAWYELPLNDRLAVIQYIKYVLAVDRCDPAKPYAFFVEEPPGPPLYIGTPPAPSQQLARTRQGNLGAGEMLGVPW